VDAGTRSLGHHVDVAFYAQHQLEVLDPSRSVLEELEAVAKLDDHPRLRAHLGAFLFSGDDVAKRVSVLSGGEKARLALARMLLRPANFLVMDEPTNHLDLAACEVLESALGEYRGTLLFVSHDRILIDAIATRVVEVQGGALTDHLGGYSAWRRAAAAREARGEAAPAPASAASGSARAGEGREERMARREREKAASRELARDRRRLAGLEAEIASLEAELEALAAKLAAPEIWRDGAAARALEAGHQALREELAGRYREWEALAASVERPDAERP
jgi:ATP-binding cassette subfamily F protein 3